MSLLQEALKRKESGNAQPVQNAPAGAAVDPQAPAESGERKPLGLARPPGQGAPEQTMPVAERVLEAGAPRSRSKSSVKWIMLALLVLSAAAVALAGAYFFFPQFSAMLSGGKSAPAPENTAQAPAAAPTSAVQASAQVQASPAATAAAAAATAAVAAAESPAAPQQPATNAPVQAEQAAPKKPARPAARPAPQAPRWPELKLSGILRGGGHKESSAFINGKMYSAGQSVEGVEIVEIQPQGVLLKYSGETRFLRVGAISY